MEQEPGAPTGMAEAAGGAASGDQHAADTSPRDASFMTNVFALEGLVGSAYCVYRIQAVGSINASKDTPPAGRQIAERVRFLEHGVGVEIAAMAAAVAMVNDSGSALASVVSGPLKPIPTASSAEINSDDLGDQSSSHLWVFSSSPKTVENEMTGWDAKLAPYFVPIRRGVWGAIDSAGSNSDSLTAGSPTNSQITEGMLAAVRENIMRSLMRQGFVPLEGEMILPEHHNSAKQISPHSVSTTFTSHATTPGPAAATTPGAPLPMSVASPYAPSPVPGVTTSTPVSTGAAQAMATATTNAAAAAGREANAFTVIPFLTSSDQTEIAVRIAARRATYAFVTEADLEAGTPFEVCTSPHGTPGTLVPLKSAGEGLATNVLKRWREAGLIPDHDLATDNDCRRSKSVVYVRQGPLNEEIPIPRSCVLRLIETVRKGNTSDEKLHGKPPNVLLPDFGITAVAQMLWRAKKRPRSPATNSPAPDFSTPVADPKPLTVPDPDKHFNTKTTREIDPQRVREIDPSPLDHDKLRKAQPPAAARSSTQGPSRIVAATPRAVSRDNGYDVEVGDLADVEELDVFFSSSAHEKSGEKAKKKGQTQPSQVVSNQVGTDRLASTSSALDPMDVEAPSSSRGAIAPEDESTALQRLFEEDMRSFASDLYATTTHNRRTQRSQILALPLMSGGISKKRVNSFKYRQTLRNIYVPSKKSKLLTNTPTGRTAAQLVPKPKRLATSGKIDSSSVSVENETSGSSDSDSTDHELDSPVKEGRSATSLVPTVAIDCASVCHVLRVSDRLVSSLDDSGDEGLRESRLPTDVNPSKAKTKVPVGAILSLMDMQVLGNVDMWLKHPLTSSRKKPFLQASPEIRKSLFSFPRLLKEAWPKSDSAPVKLVGPLGIDRLPDSVDHLATPKVCVGHGEDWIETSMSVLPVWEKAGLNPFSGPKNVKYAVLAPKWKAADTSVFFRDLSTAYEECRFGMHSPLPHDSTFYVGDADATVGLDSSSPEESQLLSRYSLAIAGLAAKLEAAEVDNANYRMVLYVVSPFPSSRENANASLLKALVPLASLRLGSASAVLRAPWKAPSQDSVGILPIVKVISTEVLVRSFSTLQVTSAVPLRPQMMKAFANSVYDSLRGRSLRGVAEMSAISTGYSNFSPEIMSPVTPEQAISLPVSGRKGPNGTQDVFADVGACRGRSVLYEPAVVLAGLGRHLSGHEAPSENGHMVFHICYGYCTDSKRFYCGISDSRGESLDFFTSPELDIRVAEERRRAFALMWNRGRRWWLSFVEHVRVVISKLESMNGIESSDWASLISDLLGNKSLDGNTALVSRLPGRDGRQQSSNFFEKAGYSLTADSEMQSTIGNPKVVSVSIVTVQEDETLSIMSRRESNDQGGSQKVSFIYGCEKGPSHASAFLTSAAGKHPPIKISLLRHFGGRLSSDGDASPRSDWDSSDCRRVVGQIARNFNELSALSIPPSGPQDSWDSRWPRHVQVVQNLRHLGKIVLQ